MKELAFEFNGHGECTNIYYIDKDVFKINKSQSKHVPITVIWLWKHFRKGSKTPPYEDSIAWFNMDSTRYFMDELTIEQYRSILSGIFKE